MLRLLHFLPTGKPFYILHYTYGMDYKLSGEFTPGKFGEWRFDKRTYGSRPPPRHLGEPPKNMKNDLVRCWAFAATVRGHRRWFPVLPAAPSSTLLRPY